MPDESLGSESTEVAPPAWAQARGTYSADGRWFWDGVHWYPASSVPPIPPAPAQGANTAPVAQPASGYVVAPKSPGIALLVSFFLPGVGSIMNGETGKGVGILLGYLASWVLFWLLFIIVVGFLFLFVGIGLWIWGMVDAYTGAQRWNRMHGIVS